MRPFTDVLPKPLLPFLNTPIITYPLSQLSQAGVRRVALNLHHLRDTIPPVVDRLAAPFGLSIKYVHEWELLGSGGGLLGMASTFDESIDVLVFLNGDTILDIDLRAQIEAHIESDFEVSLLVRPKVESQPGRVFVDGERITRIRDYRNPNYGEHHSEHDFLGVHILNRSVLDGLPVEECDIIDTLYGRLVEEGKVRAAWHEGFFAALDTPELLFQTSVDVLTDPDSCGIAPLPDPLRDGLYVYRPGSIAAAAEVAPPILIGANVEVEEGARLGPGVVLDGVHVCAGTTIENALLYGMGQIEGEWRDCVGIAGEIVQLK